MLNKIYKIGLISTVVVLPVFANAQLQVTSTFFRSAKDLVTFTLIPLVFTLALLFFFWGVVKYIRSAGNEKEEGKKIMIWGVVALFVMSSVWGLVSFIQNELLVDKGTQGTIPTIK